MIHGSGYQYTDDLEDGYYVRPDGKICVQGMPIEGFGTEFSDKKIEEYREFAPETCLVALHCLVKEEHYKRWIEMRRND